jgi:hypothetical protein
VKGRKLHTAFSYGTNSKSHGNSSEHALIDSEEEIGNLGGANRGGSESVTETNILQITDEFACGVRESKGVTPEEPLEGNDSRSHDGQPDEGQSRLAASQTRIEEATQESQLQVVLHCHVFFVYALTLHRES